MSELTRKLVSQVRRFIANRRGHKRARTNLRFTLELARQRTSPNGSRRIPSLEGHTLDISRTGMGLIVPAIRIGEHYLTGGDRRLKVKLELPEGTVEMLMTPIRYESLDEDQSEIGYLVGARIAEMTEDDRSRFEAYVTTLIGK